MIIGYSHSCHVCNKVKRKNTRSYLGINQLVLLHLWCITGSRRLLSRRLPGVELLDNLRADAIQLLLREDA